MTMTYRALIQDCVHFVLCPKQANKIEGVVLNRVCILGSFVLNKVRVKPSVAHLYPNIGRVPTHGFVVEVATVITPDTALIFRPLNSVPGKTETTL